MLLTQLPDIYSRDHINIFETWLGGFGLRTGSPSEEPTYGWLEYPIGTINVVQDTETRYDKCPGF
jgi:hypothetical protein